MKIVISPAKSLNFDNPTPSNSFTEPLFLNQSQEIQDVLKQKTPSQLGNMMHISEKLSDLNWQRNQNWKLPFTPQNSRQAIYTFDGDVYAGLDAHSINSNKIESLQNKVRILSGLYGLLKPLDLIQAYRLEMGTKIEIASHKNLYSFWKQTLTQALNEELNENELFINLASKEYFSVIDTKMLKVPVITPEFKEYKNGQLKIISFFAKRARGLMARYIIDTEARSIDDLINFTTDGYQFDSSLSSESTLIFTR